MRIGLVTQLLWNRYGDLWQHLFTDVDAEIVFADPERTLNYLTDERLTDMPLTFALAAAQSLALSDTDYLLLPSLNDSDSPKGSGQDPWIANFPETLSTSLGGLPSVMSVPTRLEGVEGLVTQHLLKIARDPAKVRRSWEKNKARVKAPRVSEPRWQKRASESEGIGLIAQPWLRPELGLADSVHVVRQFELDPAMLRDEGKRFDDKLIPTDQEVIGATRLMSRKGNIDRLIFVADKNSGADLQLYKRVQKLSHKAVELNYLQDLASPEAVLVLP